MRHLIAAGVILCALPLPAGAQEAGRFTMTPTATGVIRLDTRTGALSTCVSGAEGLVCRAAQDEGAAGAQRLARLEEENARLRRRLGEESAPVPAPAPAPNADDRSAREADRALGMMERFLRRFHSMVEDWRREEGPGERT